ncbi:hypothetical protein MMC28_001727 [Mycoblastus sanguinarius]|nr:hypothetical protein [Mycoblastus sanguinarius]
MVQTSPWKDVLHAGTPPPMPAAIFGMATAFMGVALYLVLEINLTVLRRFKKHRGLYFWSLLISAWGVCLHSVGYILQWWTPKSPWALNTACILLGWSMMVTCQSLVLYSRLHLVIRNYDILRGVLILIITTAIVIEIPQWVTTWASTDPKLSVTRLWSPYDSIMVRVSQLAFLLQESTLSFLYVWGAVKVLSVNDKIDVRRVKWDLIYINIYLVLVDVIILVLAYTNEHFPKEPIQNFAYAFKLKIEFVVLNQLLAVTSQARPSNHNSGNRYVKSSSFGSTPHNARSKPSADSASRLTRNSPNEDVNATPGKQHFNLSTFAFGPKSPDSISKSHSGSLDSGIDVKSPTASYGKGQYFGSHRDRTDSNQLQPFQEYNSNENLAPSNPAAGSDRVRGSPNKTWWMRLWSSIPTGEERLQKDLSRVQREEMRV